MPLRNLKHPSIPPSLRGPTLLAGGRPTLRYWGTVWITLNIAHVSDSTARKQAYAIETFYRYAEEHSFEGLDHLIEAGELNTLRDLATSFLLYQRNRAISRNIDASRSWKTVVRFLGDAVTGPINASNDNFRNNRPDT